MTIYDPYMEEEYDPITVIISCHTPSCYLDGGIKEEIVYHPSDVFYCTNCGQRMW